MRRYSPFFALLLFLSVAFYQMAFIPTTKSRSLASSEDSPPFSMDAFKESIIKKMPNVDEFKVIAEYAKEHKIKIYLAGGTASTWANYVFLDLLRQNEKRELKDFRFDFDLRSIYATNQDLDLAIEGSADEAAQFEQFLNDHLPVYQNNKSAWEVIPLRENRGVKVKWLDSEDRLLQHSDSMSSGLIELSGQDVHPIHDAGDFSSNNLPFINDLYHRTVHYYFRPDGHVMTEKYKLKQNPEIFSVLRILNKSFSLDLKLSQESIPEIKKVISNFDPKSITEGYNLNWTLFQVSKLFSNTQNLEASATTMKKLGLTDELKKIQNNSIQELLSKKPLPRLPLGLGDGKTAKELGLTKINHVTSSLMAYESITWPYNGDLNFFISRDGVAGETAYHGEGVYFSPNDVRGKSGDVVITAKLNPLARENHDFIVVPSGILILNANAISQDPLELDGASTPLSLLKYLSETPEKEINLAIVEKMKRKAIRLLKSEGAENEVMDYIKTLISEKKLTAPALKFWFSLPQSKHYPKLLEQLISDELSTSGSPFLNFSLSVIKKYQQNDLINVFTSPLWKDHLDLLRPLLQANGKYDYNIFTLLSKIQTPKSDEFIEYYLNQKNHSSYLFKVIENRSDKPEWLKKLIEQNFDWNEFLVAASKGKLLKEHPKLLEKALISKRFHLNFLNYILVQDEYLDRADWLEKIMKEGTSVEPMLRLQPKWRENSKIRELLAEGIGVDTTVIRPQGGNSCSTSVERFLGSHRPRSMF